MLKKKWVKVRFKEEYYGIVRPIVDNHRLFNPIGLADGKGIFNSYIKVEEYPLIDKGYCTISFVPAPGKLNFDLMKESICTCKKYGIIEEHEGLF